jgi:anti-sigma regulatory factor (Ser/Thr protein kinase)
LGEVVDDAEVRARLALVVTELATNALRHAQARAHVRLSRADGAWLVEVLDHRPDLPIEVPESRAHGEGGHGLLIVEKLASSLGWYAADNAKHVWALVDDDKPDSLPDLTAEATPGTDGMALRRE